MKSNFLRATVLISTTLWIACADEPNSVGDGSTDASGGVDESTGSSGPEESATDTSGGQDESTGTSGGPDDVLLEIPAALELCANSQVSVPVPQAFARFTVLNIPAGIHSVGPLTPWTPSRDGSKPLPEGVAIDLGANVSFPNVSGEATFAFGEGNWAAIPGLDIRAWPAQDLTWLSPAALPRASGAPLTRATLRVETATPAIDGTIVFDLPDDIDELTNFNVSLFCSYTDSETCVLGDEPVPQGLAINLVPCGSAGPTQLLRVASERGELEFVVEFQQRLAEPSFGIGLLRSTSGTYQGVDFAQEDISQLAMSSALMSVIGYGEEFGVLFDEPIDGVCGLVVLNLEFEPQEPLDPLGRIAYEITCDMERGEAFELLDYEFVEPSD